MYPKILVLFVLFISILKTVTCFEVTVNDEEIDNPASIIKSKFKKYLPELQENLEIPVTEKQQSIRESFIPKKIYYPHHGLISRFRKDMVMITTTTTMYSSPTNTDNGNTDDDTDYEEGTDSNDEEMKGTKIAAKYSDTPRLHSRRSWVKDFLIFKEQKHTSASSSKKKDKNKNKENQKLQSKITNYDDAASDPRDLKRWVRLIVDEGKDEPYTQSKYLYKNEIELDIEEFIRYLVDEQGFNSTDLEFLRSKNLDYGLGEIERELNKLKEAKGSPKVIAIGGENDLDGGSGGAVVRNGRALTDAYLAIIVVCLLLC